MTTATFHETFSGRDLSWDDGTTDDTTTVFPTFILVDEPDDDPFSWGPGATLDADCAYLTPSWEDEEPDPVGGEEPVEVWRVEHPVNGVGPYNANNNRELSWAEADALYEALDRIDSGDLDHLPPQAYGLQLRYADDRVCGAPSYQGLVDWFANGALDLLIERAGFEVKRYLVHPEHVWVLDAHQAVFDRDHATEI